MITSFWDIQTLLEYTAKGISVLFFCSSEKKDVNDQTCTHASNATKITYLREKKLILVTLQKQIGKISEIEISGIGMKKVVSKLENFGLK